MDRQLQIDVMLSAARSYVGARWRHRGRSRYGVDCIGLVVLSLAAAGVQMRDRLDYGREPWRDGLDRELRDHFGAPVPGMQAGDVVSLRGPGQPEPGHVGVVGSAPAGYLTLIHSYNADSNTRVVEHRLDSEWLGRIHRVYRPFP